MNHLYNNLSTIRNGYNGGKALVSLTYSNKTVQILKLFQSYGFVKLWYQKNPRELEVYLKYVSSLPSVKNITIISKPSHQVQLSFKELSKLQNTYGILILETVYGYQCHQSALNYQIGGKPLLLVR